MSKFNVGDRVRVKYFKKLPFHWVNNMKVWMGKEVTIRHEEYNDIRIYEDTDENYKYGWLWEASDFESADFLSDKDLIL